MHIFQPKLLVCVLYFLGYISFGKCCPDTCTCDGTIVDCSGLGMNKIPADIPTNCTSLNLTNNVITEIVQNDFLGLTDLENLYLDGNEIEQVGSGVFASLVDLKILSLANNDLQSLPDTVFANNSKLLSVNLQNNSMSHISLLTFSSLENLTDFRVVLSLNPWLCDCEIKEYKLWLENIASSTKEKFDIICQSPTNLLGQSLIDTKVELICPQPPVFSELFRMVNVNEGDSIQIVCETGITMYDRISWVLPDKSVVSPNSVIDSEDVSFANNGKVLNINSASMDLAGIYVCVIHRGSDKDISLASVSVNGTKDTSEQPKVIIKEICRSHKTSSYIGVFLGGFILAILIAGCIYPVYRYCKSHIRGGMSINRDTSPKAKTYYENNGIHLQDFHSGGQNNEVRLQDFQAGEQKI